MREWCQIAAGAEYHQIESFYRYNTESHVLVDLRLEIHQSQIEKIGAISQILAIKLVRFIYAQVINFEALRKNGRTIRSTGQVPAYSQINENKKIIPEF